MKIYELIYYYYLFKSILMAIPFLLWEIGQQVGNPAEYAKNVALENVTSAKKVLEILPDSESKQMLFDLADFVLERHS